MAYIRQSAYDAAEGITFVRTIVSLKFGSVCPIQENEVITCRAPNYLPTTPEPEEWPPRGTENPRSETRVLPNGCQQWYCQNAGFRLIVTVLRIRVRL